VDQTSNAQHDSVIGQQADHNHTRLSNNSAHIHASSDKSEGRTKQVQDSTCKYLLDL
jgi:hypothetical protein